ncbi:MAG: hypothetical protein J5659_07455 [Clostridia bacterium]|nr:hypothetical protein [Clostridia bacterium]
MPEYKRKKIHTSRRRPKSVKVQKSAKGTQMRSEKRIKRDITQDRSIRVIRGTKSDKHKKLYVFASVVAVAVLTVILMSVLLPVGLFESSRNFFYSFGSGSFPAELSGAQVIDCVPKNNYYYVLTDTSIMIFSNGGKKLFSSVHGFLSPVITTSETRALVFDQGKNTAIIYNLSGIVDTITSKDEIITADIARDGQYALVTKSDSYASSVTVYSRKGKKLYNIKFAKDMVNGVDIANSGKKIAVSTLNAQSGKIFSSIRIYDFNSADPKFKLDLGQDTAYDIHNTGSGFFVVTHNKLRYIKWSKFTVNELDFDGEIAHMRYSNAGVMAVYNKTNDKSDNYVLLLKNSGKKIDEFEIKGIVNDIRFSRGRVYSIGDSKINIYSKHGEKLKSDICGFGVIKISVVGSNAICVITDSEIQKIVVKKGN